MNTILLDFEKLLATIKNPKNNKNHLLLINKMVDNFDDRYAEKYFMQTRILIIYMKKLIAENLNKLQSG